MQLLSSIGLLPFVVSGLYTTHLIAIMPMTVPRELFEFLATVDAGKKNRSEEYILTAAGPLVVLPKCCVGYLAIISAFDAQAGQN